MQHQLLDGVLDVIGQFEAGGGKQLDAVVLKRIVRRRHHDAGVGRQAAREQRDGRRRQDAGEPHVDTHRGDAGNQRRFEHVAREPRVAADDDARPGAVRGRAAPAPAPAPGRGAATVSGVIGSTLARPLTPSVPNSCRVVVMGASEPTGKCWGLQAGRARIFACSATRCRYSLLVVRFQLPS